ncbi:hypothetical protein S83_062202, partial [Arachis hypogaea]
AVLLRAHTLSELTLSPPFLPRRLTKIRSSTKRKTLASTTAVGSSHGPPSAAVRACLSELHPR